LIFLFIIAIDYSIIAIFDYWLFRHSFSLIFSSIICFRFIFIIAFDYIISLFRHITPFSPLRHAIDY
jgi:hypothetical protein